MTKQPVRIAVLGAGTIGRRHVEHVAADPEAQLLAIVDPAPGTRELADEHGVGWFPSFAAMASADRPDGVVIASPNQLHVAHGLECVAAGIAALVEKPIADEVASAERLVEAAEAAGVALLVGHHRRHNPLMQHGKDVIESGRLGQILAVHAVCWFHKPDEYFDVAWRREKGAGPVFLNLIHDIDNLRYLCGDIISVQACESNAVRGNPVEETAVVLLRFANGALGTVTVSDAIVAPWSWELASGENPVYPHTRESCYQIGGTHGSLSIPQLDIWFNDAKRSWWEPMLRERIAIEADDPLRRQIRHFCRVIRGEEKPLVSGREGLETLKVIAAIKHAAASGELVHVTRRRQMTAVGSEQ